MNVAWRNERPWPVNDRPSAAPATGKKTLWAWTAGTFFGAGLLKPGPGTWGSVAALLLWMSRLSAVSGSPSW